MNRFEQSAEHSSTDCDHLSTSGSRRPRCDQGKFVQFAWAAKSGSGITSGESTSVFPLVPAPGIGRSNPADLNFEFGTVGLKWMIVCVAVSSMEAMNPVA